ncbi:hypothetical protein [Labedella populi]|uniref:hypothetical protein n=1 Tax=Labedella populi TaxID=2498850 RepID=UPI001FB5F215|nr:hypothetical protein [Labedella populi]
MHTHLCYSEFGIVIEAIRGLDAGAASIEAVRSRMQIVDDIAASGFGHGRGRASTAFTRRTYRARRRSSTSSSERSPPCPTGAVNQPGVSGRPRGRGGVGRRPPCRTGSRRHAECSRR